MDGATASTAAAAIVAFGIIAVFTTFVFFFVMGGFGGLLICCVVICILEVVNVWSHHNPNPCTLPSKMATMRTIGLGLEWPGLCNRLPWPWRCGGQGGQCHHVSQFIAHVGGTAAYSASRVESDTVGDRQDRLCLR